MIYADKSRLLDSVAKGVVERHERKFGETFKKGGSAGKAIRERGKEDLLENVKHQEHEDVNKR